MTPVPGELLTADDLAGFTTLPPEQVEVMIGDVSAMAFAWAPCLQRGVSETTRAAALAIIRGAVIRWSDQITRDDRTMTAGPFTIGSAQTGGIERKALLWPSELNSLAKLCAQEQQRGSAYVGWLA